MSEYMRTPLQVGDRVRLESPRGSTATVVYVSKAAAYVQGGAQKEITIRPKALDQIEALGAKAVRAALSHQPDEAYKLARLAAHAAVELGMPQIKVALVDTSAIRAISLNSAVWPGSEVDEDIPVDAFSIDDLPEAGA